MMSILGFIVFLSFVPDIETCSANEYLWQPWGPCTHFCGGGTRTRHGDSCYLGWDKIGHGKCGENCHYNNPYYSDRCHCSSWRTGRCCETCQHIYISNCKSGHQQCGGSPDNIKCTSCETPYYSGGYGKGCLENIETTTSPITTTSKKVDTNKHTTERTELQTTDQKTKILTMAVLYRTSTETALKIETTHITKETTTIPFITNAFESAVMKTKSITSADKTTPQEQTIDIQDFTETTESIRIQETTSHEETTESQQRTTDITYIKETTEDIIFETTLQGVENTSICSCVCPTLQSMCAPVSNALTTETTHLDSVCTLPDYMKELLTTYSCNYDNGMCGYVITVYPHLWEMTSGRYGNATVGEIVGDHSKDSSGGYLVFNTNNNNVPQNTAHVVTLPIFPSEDGGQYCFSFWYNMPTNVSVLEVLVVDTQDQHRELVWSSIYTQTAGWTHVSINIVTNNSFHIEFSSKKNDYLGFVAIDDVLVSKEKLTDVSHKRNVRDKDSNIIQAGNQNNFAATADDPECSCTCPTLSKTDCTPTTEVTDKESCGSHIIGSSVASLSCAFDNRDSCMYDIPIYPHLWELTYFMYGNTTVGTINMDASKDGDGGYIIFSTDNYHVESGQSGSLTSSVYVHVGNMCLKFSFNMPTTQASLQVYVKTHIDTLLWKTNGTATQGWTDLYLPFVANGTFQIVFQSTKTGLFSYVGVDDINVFSNI